MNRLTITALAVSLAAAQSFDVATLKLVKGPINLSQGAVIRGRTVTCIAVTLRDLLSYAYDVRYEQLGGGPSWVGEDHYDVMAKSEGDGVLKQTESRQMLQKLLADRFQLQVHRETQEVPMYALVVAKGGPKLKPATETTRCYSVRSNEKGMRMEARCGTMDHLVRQLAGTAGRFVVDRTGLTGQYVFTLEWGPQNRSAESDVPSMLDAVQEQLGLKLESTRGPLEKLVIDRAERPTEN
jgi:uncharacterized protein (TIGR03435 family)